MIPQNIIEQVQLASDIVEVVQSYLPLKKSGRSYKACCPFHGEKTPSFFAHPEKQIWHCFGCGAGGSVFNFVMQYERLSFPEAVRLLAKRAGIAVPEKHGREEGGKKEALYRLNQFAAAWFRGQLEAAPAGPKVRVYLHRRGMNDELIDRFSLGYAPDARDSLARAARAKGFRDDALLELGLSMRREGERGLYDRFRGRLMIPIADAGGRTVAFSGRVLGKEKTPKYMNSPESALFSKSRSLYGLHQARRAIVEQGAAVVVEGYFDCLALYAAGICNVVASQGTAFTADHARILRRFAPEVVMSFDADAAGEGAALRSLDALLVEGLRVRILVLPQGHDPDTFVRERGGEAFRTLIAEAREYFDFLLERLCRRHGAGTEVGKARIAGEFLGALSRVRDGVLREAYRKKLSERLGVREETLLEAMAARRRAREAAPPAVAPPWRDDPLPPGEREIIRLMMEDESAIGRAAAELAPSDFRDPRLQRIAEHCFSLRRENRWAGCARLVACLDDERCARAVSALLAEEAPGGDRAKILGDCIRWLKCRNLDEEIGSITREIGRVEKAGLGDEEILRLQRRLMKKKSDLLKLKRADGVRSSGG